MLKVITCVTHDHDLRLVALSALICGLGAFTTLTLLGRAQDGGRRAAQWTAAAAVVFGCAIWSLHFVAMLAFITGLPISYDFGLTAASVVVPVGGSWAAFALFRSGAPRALRIVGGGLLLAAAISGMHYTGVAAMRFAGILTFAGEPIAASLAISAAFSILALARAGDLSRTARRIEVAAWLALGIVGLHFTGMSSITVVPGAPGPEEAGLLGSAGLAVVVGGTSVMILIASLAAALMEQHLAARTVQELDRMRLLSNLSHEALLIHRDQMVLEVNCAGERLFKRPAAALIGCRVTELFAEGSVAAMCRRFKAKPDQRKPEEIEIVTADGAIVAVEVSCQEIVFMGGTANALAMRDLTDRKRDEARIRHLARHDALTNLPNRTTLQERLDIALEAAAFEGGAAAVIYLDLDRFKPVNDLHGHAVGDALLVRATRRMQVELGPGDMLARIGGDEFIVVSTAAQQPGKVADLARRIIEALSQPFQIEGHPIEIGASAGIALYPADGDTPDALMRAADTAMYRVKDEGRGTFRFFEPSMNAQLQARRLLEQQLGHAITSGELLLHYQPIVDGATGEVETFEALIRWRHPERGMVPPADFIPFAEETGLISRIGAWVIDAACAAAATWPQPCRVSVNVSPSQFRQGDICATIVDALQRHGLAPDRLVVEITEGVLITDTAKALAILNRLRDTGVRLALDDFGTGFSSLSYLQLFRFDKFKIDKSFVNKLGQSEDALTITRTIVNLGHNLGLEVTAEGVETAQQLGILQTLGCDHVQGFLVARPAAEGAFGELDRIRARSLFQGAPERLTA